MVAHLSFLAVVCRGTCSWGSAGRFPGASANKSRKSDSTSSHPLSSGGKLENGGKVECKPVSSTSSRNPGGTNIYFLDLLRSEAWSSSANMYTRFFPVKDGGGLLEASIQFSSAKENTVQVLDSNGKV